MLIGEELGAPYSAQAISDWEREKSQIHKDHRQVLAAIIKILHTCGGIASPEEAEALLAAGNYRGLSQAELETIFLAPTPPANPSAAKPRPQPDSCNPLPQKKALTPAVVLSGTMGALCWVSAWLAIHPILDFSRSDPDQALSPIITLTVTAVILPMILAWIVSLQPERPASFAEGLLSYFGGVVGFLLGFTNVLTLAQVSYNLYLYPWPPLLIFGFCLWPIILSLVSAKPIQRQSGASEKEIRLRDFHLRWLIPVLPLVIGAMLYGLRPAFANQLLGPILSMTLSLGLGALLWSQTRNAG